MKKGQLAPGTCLVTTRDVDLFRCASEDGIVELDEGEVLMYLGLRFEDGDVCYAIVLSAHGLLESYNVNDKSFLVDSYGESIGIVR